MRSITLEKTFFFCSLEKVDKKLFLITNLMNRKFDEVLTKLESGKKGKEESFVVRQIDPRVVEVGIDHLERVSHPSLS